LEDILGFPERSLQSESFFVQLQKEGRGVAAEVWGFAFIAPQPPVVTVTARVHGDGMRSASGTRGTECKRVHGGHFVQRALVKQRLRRGKRRGNRLIDIE
jgi:hypothetical protein